MNIGRAQTLFDAWQAGAIRDNELAELRNMLPAIFDDAIAWRKHVAREARANVRVDASDKYCGICGCQGGVHHSWCTNG